MPLTNRVTVTIVLTPSFFVCFVNFVVVICRFKVQTNNDGTLKADTGSGSRVLTAQALESGQANELIEAVLFKPIAL